MGFGDEAPFATGEAEPAPRCNSGDLRELAVAEWIAPEVAAPRQATLRATIGIGEERAENAWPRGSSRAATEGLNGVALLDPAGRLRDLRQIAPSIQAIDSGQGVRL